MTTLSTYVLAVALLATIHGACARELLSDQCGNCQYGYVCKSKSVEVCPPDKCTDKYVCVHDPHYPAPHCEVKEECHDVPHKECNKVSKQVCPTITVHECKDKPKQECKYEKKKVNCRTEYKKICHPAPHKKHCDHKYGCKDSPKQQCKDVPNLVCDKKDEKVCKEVPHKVCKDVKKQGPCKTVYKDECYDTTKKVCKKVKGKCVKPPRVPCGHTTCGYGQKCENKQHCKKLPCYKKKDYSCVKKH